MEIFNVKKARVLLYQTTKKYLGSFSEDVDPEEVPARYTCILKKQVRIKKEVSVLTDELAEKLIFGYVTFLFHAFSCFRAKITQDDLDCA